MLTEEGYCERKWGPFPALRKALEDKKVPQDYYGLTSVSDNIFDKLVRLTEIAILVNEYRAGIEETAQSTGLEEMFCDLERLEGQLESASSYFNRGAEEVRVLMKRLHEKSRFVK